MSSRKLTASGEMSGGIEGFAFAEPTWRKESATWPLTRQSVAADWSNLLKGGHNGFFLVLKLLSFWAKMACTREERLDFDAAMGDVNWVLGEVLIQLNGGSVLGVRKRRARG